MTLQNTIKTLVILFLIAADALAGNPKAISPPPTISTVPQLDEKDIHDAINLYITRYLSHDAVGVAIMDIQSYNRVVAAYNKAPQQLKNEEWRQVFIAESQIIAQHMNSKNNQPTDIHGPYKQPSPQPFYKIIYPNMQYNVIELTKRPPNAITTISIIYNNSIDAPLYQGKKIQQMLIKLPVLLDRYSNSYKIGNFDIITDLRTAPLRFF